MIEKMFDEELGEITLISSGMRLLRPLAMSLTDLKVVDVSRREVYAEKAPAGATPPADGWPVGNETCPLSFRITITFELIYAALFIASYAMPPVIAPSPIMAMQLLFGFESKFLPTDMPSAAEIEVEECPAPKQSYALSFLFVKPDIPCSCRRVSILSLRPVKIL
jgi:hypothetical protein